jgi:hypothetical protein
MGEDAWAPTCLLMISRIALFSTQKFTSVSKQIWARAHTQTHTFMGAWGCAVVQHTNVEREVGESVHFNVFLPTVPVFASSPFASSSGVQMTPRAGNRLNQSDLGKQIGKGQRFGGQTKWLNCCRGVRACAGSKTARVPTAHGHLQGYHGCAGPFIWASLTLG